MHAKLESHDAKVDSPDKALNASQKKVAAVRYIVGEQRARLDAAYVTLSELKNRRDETSVSTATCRKELHQAQKSLATALEKVKASLARAVAMAKERDTVSTKY